MQTAILARRSSIGEYLRSEVFPGLAPPPYGPIRARRISAGTPVILFEEMNRRIAVVGKLFQHGFTPLEEAWEHAEKEYLNLSRLRGEFGMNDNACKVVAPLGKSKELSAMLVMEKASGRSLDHHIAAAAHHCRFGNLFHKLGCLAGFFSRLHHNSQSGRPLSADAPAKYLQRLLETLRQGPLGDLQVDAIQRYAGPWFDSPIIFAADREVMVHGDATPTNFFFQDGTVSGIDLERMAWNDRCWDLGFIAAELKHHFMWRTGDGWAAEPFIGHFLWEYAAGHKRSGGEQSFTDITGRIPLYMALGLTRIARNEYLDLPYRQNLLREAKRCLKFGLSSSTTTGRS